jgi:hypothetical protein
MFTNHRDEFIENKQNTLIEIENKIGYPEQLLAALSAFNKLLYFFTSNYILTSTVVPTALVI